MFLRTRTPGQLMLVGDEKTSCFQLFLITGIPREYCFYIRDSFQGLSSVLETERPLAKPCHQRWKLEWGVQGKVGAPSRGGSQHLRTERT